MKKSELEKQVEDLQERVRQLEYDVLAAMNRYPVYQPPYYPVYPYQPWGGWRITCSHANGTATIG
ncbi:MAG: hypothetical protein WC322_03405 [Candidatus Paceibacterota bacterium]|jgi:hypothetical protein